MRFTLRLLILGYYPFLVGLIVAGFALFVYWLMQALTLGRVSGSVFGLGAGMVMLTIGHFAFLLPFLLHPASKEDPFEVRLPAGQSAGLRKLAWEIARERNLPPPDDLRLDGETIACVYEDDRGLRILVVGCIAVAALSQQALAGILAHELGHFGAGDTRLGRSGRSVHLFIARFEFVVSYLWLWWLNPMIWILRGYHLLFLLVKAASSRRAEYAADRHEAALVGKQVAGATLLLFEILPHLPWARLSSVGRSYAMSRERDEDVFAEQVRRARATDPGELQDACRKALKEKTGFFDSHPCLKERLKAMGVSSKKATQMALDLFREGEPASALFPNWPAIQKQFSDEIMLCFRAEHEAKLDFIRAVTRRPV